MKQIIKRVAALVMAVMMLCIAVPTVYAAEEPHVKEIDVIAKKIIDSYSNVYSTTASVWNNDNIQAGEFNFTFSGKSLFTSTSLEVHHITPSTEGYNWFLSCMSSFGGKVTPFDIYCVNNGERIEFSKNISANVKVPEGYVEPALYFLDFSGNIALVTLTENKNGYMFTVSKSGYYVFVDAADLDDDNGSIIRYTVSANAGKGGNINPSGEQIVNAGSDMTFSIAAEEGYKIADVLVDGSSVGAVESYTLTNVQKNHLIEVTFERTEVNIGTIIEDLFDWLFGGIFTP